jgi:shikimate dehydrogenase
MIKLGLVGYPLGHSLSPRIHDAALKACGLDGDYSPFPIRLDDKGELKDLLSCVRSGEIRGLNVTIPHKQNVMDYLDELTPTAKAIGAVNTIYMRANKLVGDNTDASGYLRDLRHFLGETHPSTVHRPSSIVMGAGGSARAVVYALVHGGWDVTIAARRIEQAENLAMHFEGTTAAALNVQTFQRSNLQLIVNTTPVGMTPDIDQSPLPADVILSKDTLIYDLVYNPRETKLVKEARAQGLQATTGLGMLIEQAALSFEIWTGCSPSREVMRAAVDNL